ncbi:hypothetical protein [Nostoc sp. CCY0012]
MVASGWKKIPLGDVLKLQRGFDLPHTKRQPGDIPVAINENWGKYELKHL